MIESQYESDSNSSRNVYPLLSKIGRISVSGACFPVLEVSRKTTRRVLPGARGHLTVGAAGGGSSGGAAGDAY